MTTDSAGQAEVLVQLGDKVGFQIGRPEAEYNWHCDDRRCEFSDKSSDRDGSVVRWGWRFGDGTTSSDIR